ncbi:MAG: hypothetical protein ACOC38_12265 [Promethearchaeia archaeon]
MDLSDLLIILRHDIGKALRIRAPEGKRTEKENILKRTWPILLAGGIGAFIIWIIVTLVPPIWPQISEIASQNLGFAATIFNAVLLFSFIGSIMVSASTVGNSKRMEYLMVFPVQLRTIFLEKTLVIVLYNSIFWLVIGTPIFIGFSIVSPQLLAPLGVPVFVISLLILIIMGVSAGGLIGLGAARLVAGRRLLRQVGTAIVSAVAIVGSTLWYASFYLGRSNGFAFFDTILEWAGRLGLSSDITPGYIASKLSLGLVFGAQFQIADVLYAFMMALIGIGLVYVNSYASEMAHYSGWLAQPTERTTKDETEIKHEPWDPNPIPGFNFNQTVSVSIWRNWASIRREARVVTQYLLGPIRFVIWIILPVFVGGEMFTEFTPFLIVAALIPFATSYGLYFAGYELVYEGENLMTLQLAAANMEDYIKGKIYSATPFTFIASIIVSILILFIAPQLWIYLPGVIVGCVGVNLASGAIAANAAAMGGDFKAERRVTRQRGSSVQMPIRGWSILRAQLIPYLVGYVGIFGIVIAGIIAGPIYSYLILPVLLAVCWQLLQKYAHSAGVKIAQVEATEYL